jgi:hypothetical protein
MSIEKLKPILIPPKKKKIGGNFENILSKILSFPSQIL